MSDQRGSEQGSQAASAQVISGFWHVRKLEIQPIHFVWIKLLRWASNIPAAFPNETLIDNQNQISFCPIRGFRMNPKIARVWSQISTKRTEECRYQSEAISWFYALDKSLSDSSGFWTILANLWFLVTKSAFRCESRPWAWNLKHNMSRNSKIDVLLKMFSYTKHVTDVPFIWRCNQAATDVRSQFRVFRIFPKYGQNLWLNKYILHVQMFHISSETCVERQL